MYEVREATPRSGPVSASRISAQAVTASVMHTFVGRAMEKKRRERKKNWLVFVRRYCVVVHLLLPVYLDPCARKWILLLKRRKLLSTILFLQVAALDGRSSVALISVINDKDWVNEMLKTRSKTSKVENGKLACIAHRLPLC